MLSYFERASVSNILGRIVNAEGKTEFHSLFYIYESEIKSNSSMYLDEFFYLLFRKAIKEHDQKNLIMFLERLDLTSVNRFLIQQLGDCKFYSLVINESLVEVELLNYLLSVGIFPSMFLHTATLKWINNCNPNVFLVKKYNEYEYFFLYINVLLSLDNLIYGDIENWRKLHLIQSMFPVKILPSKPVFLNKLPMSRLNIRALSNKTSFFSVIMMAFFKDKQEGFNIKNSANLNAFFQVVLYGDNDSLFECFAKTGLQLNWIKAVLEKRNVTAYDAITLCKNEEVKLELLQLIT